MKPKSVAILVAGAAALSLSLAGCTVSAASDEVLVHKGGGIIEEPKEKGCVMAATRELEKPGDSYFIYPQGQRVYDFTGTKDVADGSPISVVSKDGQTLTIPGTLTFTLTSDCSALHAFHDSIGNKDRAYFESGETSSPGWVQLLNRYMRPALDSTLDRVAKNYTWKELYSDPSIKDKLNKEVNDSVRTLINQQLEGDHEFFVGFSALIQQPVADPELVASVKANEVSVAQANAAKTKAEADAAAAQAAAKAQVAQKQAELTVKQLEAQIQAATIAPWKSPEAYNNYLAIQKGLNPFQPTYGSVQPVVPVK